MPLPDCLSEVWKPVTGTTVSSPRERYEQAGLEIELVDGEWLSKDDAERALRSLGFVHFEQFSTPAEQYYHYPNTNPWLTIPIRVPRHAISAPDICRRVREFWRLPKP
jgi:hypothetical protein